MKAEPAETPLQRADWLRLLSRCDAAALAARAAPVLADYAFEWLREPEFGLVMVRSRIGNSGDRFNLGEATATRCAVRHRTPQGALLSGVGYVLGQHTERATHIAKLDALLQRADLHDVLWHTLLQPLQAQRAAQDQARHQATQASRVRFFTLQPEAA